MFVLAGIVNDRPVRLPLNQPRLRVGRGSGNEINLDEQSISREHAEILVGRDEVRIHDLGSSNGTFINGQRIAGPRLLKPGDEVRFGSVSLSVLATLAEAAETELEPVLDANATMALLTNQNKISTGEKLSWEDSQNAADLPGVFDQVLFRAVTEAGQLLILPRPLSETFEMVLGLVEKVIPARRILLLLTDSPDGSPVIRAARPARELRRGKLMLSQTIIGTVLKERQTLLLNDVLSDPRFAAQESVIQQNLRSAMVAPLFDNEQVIGLLYADNDDLRFRYDRNQLRAFSLLANLIAVKISNARLLEAQREQERMEQEMAAAAQVQRGLLASRQPVLPGYEILAHQTPCYECAGDLYDVTQLADGRVAVVVGDVTGKGMGAAMLMSSIISALRVLYHECPSLVVLADRLHQQILRASDEIHFATMFVAMLDPAAHSLEYVNAGHDPPLLLEHDGRRHELPTTGMPMGLVPGATFTSVTVELPADCLVCIYTDGIPEAQVGEEFYGREPLVESVASRSDRPLNEIVDGALADLRDFLGDTELQDDVTMLLLRRQE
ncbi:MAG: SpoIIE family protein phosphatase [bacterium]